MKAVYLLFYIHLITIHPSLSWFGWGNDEPAENASKYEDFEKQLFEQEVKVNSIDEFESIVDKEFKKSTDKEKESIVDTMKNFGSSLKRISSNIGHVIINNTPYAVNIGLPGTEQRTRAIDETDTFTDKLEAILKAIWKFVCKYFFFMDVDDDDDDDKEGKNKKAETDDKKKSEEEKKKILEVKMDDKKKELTKSEKHEEIKKDHNTEAPSCHWDPVQKKFVCTGDSKTFVFPNPQDLTTVISDKPIEGAKCTFNENTGKYTCVGGDANAKHDLNKDSEYEEIISDKEIEGASCTLDPATGKYICKVKKHKSDEYIEETIESDKEIEGAQCTLNPATGKYICKVRKPKSQEYFEEIIESDKEIEGAQCTLNPATGKYICKVRKPKSQEYIEETIESDKEIEGAKCTLNPATGKYTCIVKKPKIKITEIEETIMSDKEIEGASCTYDPETKKYKCIVKKTIKNVDMGHDPMEEIEGAGCHYDPVSGKLICTPGKKRTGTQNPDSHTPSLSSEEEKAKNILSPLGLGKGQEKRVAKPSTLSPEIKDPSLLHNPSPKSETVVVDPASLVPAQTSDHHNPPVQHDTPEPPKNENHSGTNTGANSDDSTHLQQAGSDLTNCAPVVMISGIAVPRGADGKVDLKSPEYAKAISIQQEAINRRRLAMGNSGGKQASAQAKASSAEGQDKKSDTYTLVNLEGDNKLKSSTEEFASEHTVQWNQEKINDLKNENYSLLPFRDRLMYTAKLRALIQEKALTNHQKESVKELCTKLKTKDPEIYGPYVEPWVTGINAKNSVLN